MAQSPIDYSLGLTPLNPAQQIMQGMAVGQGLLDAREQGLERQQAAQMRPIQMQGAQLGLRTGLAAEADANAARALQQAAMQSQAIRAARMQEDMQSYLASPTPDAANKFFTQYPEHPLAKQYDKVIAARTDAQKEQDFNALAQVTTALERKNPDAAISFLEDRSLKFAAAGDDEQAKAMKAAADMVRRDPQQSLAYMQGMLVRIAPSIGKDITALRSVEADVREAEAKAALADVNAINRQSEIASALGLQKAQAAKYYADMRNDAKRLDLDERKFAAETEQKLKEMEFKAGEIPTNLVPEVLSLGKEATAAGMQAQKWDDIAQKFDKAEGVEGAAGAVADTFKKWAGYDDDITMLRRQFLGLKASGVMANLPPGAASDTDVALASGEFPSEFGDKKKLAEFSRTMSRIQRADENIKAARAEFLARNKGAGVARVDFTVRGVPVRAGETEADAMRRVGAAYRFKNSPAAPAPTGGRRTARGLVDER